MRVTLLKDWKTRKAGDTFDTTDQRAKQLIDAGVAQSVVAQAELPVVTAPSAVIEPPIPAVDLPGDSLGAPGPKNEAIPPVFEAIPPVSEPFSDPEQASESTQIPLRHQPRRSHYGNQST